MSEEYLLQMSGITKKFPGTIALNHANLSVRRGSVHALVGENGAGKSTLMKILIGLYQPDEGEIRFKGREIKLKNVYDSIQNGISMIQQELSSVLDMTVAENIFLGKEMKNRFHLMDDKFMNAETKQLMDRLEIEIDPTLKMRSLSVANLQMVEIAKAISYDSDLVIMDEPTSALTEREVEHLYKIIASLKAEGRSVIYITHKMDEIFQVCDEITVLRDGQFVGTETIGNLTKDTLVAMMVGRPLKDYYYKEKYVQNDVVLKVEGLTVTGLFEDVSFEVHKGEVLGFSGLIGAGRTEVVETLFGLHKPSSGKIFVNGKEVQIGSSTKAIDLGMGLLTEDRKRTGLFAPLDIQSNLSMACLSQFCRLGFLNSRKLTKACLAQVDSLRIKMAGLEQVINDLSGGNQQKVLIARWLINAPHILFLDEPTKGIDVYSKSEIYKLINNLAAKGTAIVMISSEMPELLGMSDRVLVMAQGRVNGILDIAEATQKKILTLAMGESISGVD